MDRLSTENDEFGFDDNGLLNEFLLASRQEKIVSSECICHCDVIPSGRDEDKATKVGFDERKSYWIAPFDDERGTTSFGEPSGSVSVINDNEHTEYTQALPNDRKDSKGSTGLTDNLDLPVCHIFKKEGAENVYGTRSIRWGEVETTEAKFRSGRSSKDRGFRTSSTDSEILSSLACLWATSFAMTSWKLSVSLTVGILLQMPYVGKYISFLFDIFKISLNFFSFLQQSDYNSSDCLHTMQQILEYHCNTWRWQYNRAVHIHSLCPRLPLAYWCCSLEMSTMDTSPMTHFKARLQLLNE